MIEKMENGRPVAFVAMQFTNDHWRDKRYIAIQEELNHAGFSCVRADEIKTSGPVVDEVCRLLREADLVVIVSTGDSHSVSYEIGYCHGVGRAGDSTLLLRDNSDIPFNYRHYRHRVYRVRIGQQYQITTGGQSSKNRLRRFTRNSRIQ